MNTGGFIKGEICGRDGREYDGDESEKHWPSIEWGTLTRDAKLSCINKPKVELCIRFRRGYFLNCTIWGDHKQYRMATRLKEGDVVFVAGDWKEKGFHTREGWKTYYDVKIECLFSADILCALAEMLYDDLPSDRMESAEDEFDDENGVPGF